MRRGKLMPLLATIGVLAIVLWCHARPPFRRFATLETPLRVVVDGPFLFTTDIVNDEIRDLGVVLLALENKITTELQLPRLSEPVRFYLFQDKSRYLRFLRQHFPDLTGSAERRRAMFLLRGGMPHVFAYRTADLQRDLRHEFTHALLNTSLHRLPLWIDEGLAVFYETLGGTGEQPAYLSLLLGQLPRGGSLAWDSWML